MNLINTDSVSRTIKSHFSRNKEFSLYNQNLYDHIAKRKKNERLVFFITHHRSLFLPFFLYISLTMTTTDGKRAMVFFSCYFNRHKREKNRRKTQLSIQTKYLKKRA